MVGMKTRFPLNYMSHKSLVCLWRKRIACILALVSVGTVGNSLRAEAEESATVSFSGYVAPACTVASIDSNTILPSGGTPNEYILLRCNTGEEYRLVRRDAPVHDNGNEEFLTVVP